MRKLNPLSFPLVGGRPWPDGLFAIFFQTNWDHVGPSLCKWIRDVFQKPPLIGELNGTFLSLIPKVDKLENFSQFRPIGLCNVVYKTIT